MVLHIPHERNKAMVGENYTIFLLYNYPTTWFYFPKYFWISESSSSVFIGFEI